MQPLALNQLSPPKASDTIRKHAAQPTQPDRPSAFAHHLAKHAATIKPDTTSAQHPTQIKATAQHGEKEEVAATAVDTKSDGIQTTPTTSDKADAKNTEDRAASDANAAVPALDLATQMLNQLAPQSIQNIKSASDQHLTQDNIVANIDDESARGVGRTRDQMSGRSAPLLPGQTDEETTQSETSTSITAASADSVKGMSSGISRGKDDFAKALTPHGHEQLSATTALDLSQSPTTQLANSPTSTQTTPPANTSVTQFAPTSSIPYTVGTGPWNEHITHQIKWMVGGDQQSATLTLNPPELGPLHITVQIDQGQANTSFGSDNPDVQRAIEQSMPKLREALSDAGFSLGLTSVTDFATSSQTSSGSSRDRGNNSAGNSGASSGISTTTTSSPGSVASPSVARISNGLVDTYA